MTTKNNVQRLDSYNSYSGCDMVATAKISSHDALKNNIYTLGSIQTISISTHQDKRPVRSLGNINAKEYTMGQRTIAGSLVFAVFDRHFADEMFKDSLDASQIGTSTIILPDELPPFDITISYANEYGHASKMALYGVRLVNEGQVMSINDIFTENTYQFVATGLEPLTKEHLDRSTKERTKNDEEYYYRNIPLLNENDVNNILDYPDYGITFNNKEEINLSSKVEQPIAEDDYGIARFYLSPAQTSGFIKIFASSSQTREPILYNIESSKNNNHYLYLPIDNYYAYYETDSKLSNTTNFSVYFSKQDIQSNNDMPIIDFATHNSIALQSNNKDHKYAIAEYKTSDNVSDFKVEEIKSKKATFRDLNKSTVYKVYTSNVDTTEGIKSNYVTVSTLSSEFDYLYEFEEFLTLNKSLLTYNLKEYLDVISTLDKTHNLIDFILRYNTETTKEDTIKKELLLFATKYQNIINKSLNRTSYLKAPDSDLNNPFGNTINFDNNTSHSNVFRKEKNKNYFENKITNKETYTHEGRDLIKYMCSSSTQNSLKSASYEFCCFNYKDKEMLSRFNNSNKLNETNFTLNYPVSKINELKCGARYYKKPAMPILSKPKLSINRSLALTVNPCYDGIIKENDVLVIAIAKVKECLDFTPFMKKYYKYTGKDFTLDAKTTGILFNESYAIWIEDTEGTIISYCETFDTYFNNAALVLEEQDIKDKEIEKELNKIEKTISDYMILTSDIRSCMYSVLEQEDVHVTNIHEKIIEVLIDNKFIIKDLLKLIHLILSSKFKLDTLVSEELCNKITYNRMQATISFDTNKNNLDYSVMTINTEDNLIKKYIEDYTEVYDLPMSNFILVYLLDKSKTRKSGYILIDRTTKEFETYNMKVEVI